jgi:hypothetical protein
MKICYRCKIEKNETEFTKDNNQSDSLDIYCRQCKRKSTSKGLYKLRNTEDGFLRHRINMLYTPSAIKKRGFAPECTKEEIVKSYYKYTQKYGKNCFYCNETFTFTYNEYTPNNGNNRVLKGVKRQSRNLSFDRLDTSKTYFIDNIIFCCTQCNSSKKDISISLIKRLYDIITERNL